MRVIAGSLGGRRFAAPKGRDTRPTPDRVREALFSALGLLDGATVLDLYAGSGALAIEALSRGALRAVLVERASAALRVLRRNLVDLGLDRQCEVLALPVERAAVAVAAGGPYDLVLADPPYADLDATPAIDDLLTRPGVAAQAARLIVEHSGRKQAPVFKGAQLIRTRRYGDTAISSFHLAPPDGHLGSASVAD